MFHPTATTNLASLDPAQRLMHQGKGPLALELMLRATEKSAKWVLAIVLGIIALTSFLAIDPYQTIKLTKQFSLIVIPAWMLYTVSRSQDPGITFIGFCLISIYGYYCLHHPTQRGSEHSLLPVLAGLIAIPMVIQTITDSKTQIPKQRFTFKPDERPELAMLGSIVGSLSGLLAGIGASSLVSALQDKTRNDEDYVYLSTAAETANQLMAIALVAFIGLTRSGEAVILNRQLPDLQNQPQLIAIIGLCIVLSMVAGKWLTIQVAPSYIEIIQKIPVKPIAMLVGLVTLLTLTLTPSPMLSLLFTAVGTVIALGCRKLEIPNQTVFACMAFPVLVYQTGTTWFFNRVLGL